MNRVKFSTIAHRDHLFANPIGEAKIDRVLQLFDLSAGNHVLDVGCGNAELLIRLIEHYAVVGIGVDPNAAALAVARQRASERINTANLHLHNLPINKVVIDRPMDAALCIGSTHAYGDYDGTLHALRELVRPGGLVLIGEGYWKRAPNADYLTLLGSTVDELIDPATNISRAVAAGLTPLYTVVSNDDEWDHYEGLYCRTVERYVAAHPDDPESAEFRDYIRQWYAGYVRWGRATLRFGLYLYQVS